MLWKIPPTVFKGILKFCLLSPTLSSQSPEVVPRRPRGELSEDEQRKLEHQRVPRGCHHDDLSIMKARYWFMQKGQGLWK